MCYVLKQKKGENMTTNEKRLELNKIFTLFLSSGKLFGEFSKQTKASYTRVFNRFLDSIDYTTNDNALILLNKTNVNHFLIKLKTSGKYHQNTIALHVNCLKSFSRFLYEQELLDYEFMKGIRMPKKINDFVYTIPPNKLKEFLSAPAKYSNDGNRLFDEIFLLLLIACGLRRSEVINLKWEHIDFERNCLTILNTKNNKNRILPLPPILKDKMLKYKTIYRFSKKKKVMTFSDRTELSAFKASQLFNKYRSLCNCNEATPHSCRHTFATMLANEVDCFELCKLLGHSDPKTTSNFYYSFNISKASDNFNNSKLNKIIEEAFNDKK